MRKIFNVLLLLLTAINSNVNFYQKEDVIFSGDASYYNTGNYAEVDYQDMYNSYVGIEGDAGCKIKQRFMEMDLKSGTKGGYWVVSGATVPDNSTTVEVNIGATQGDVLVAPRDLIVATDANSSRYGTFMCLETLDNKYRFTFYNMDRWFCCLDRDVTEKNEFGFVHTKNAKGFTIRKGNIVGLATTTTELLIEEADDSGEFHPISINNYYMGN